MYMKMRLTDFTKDHYSYFNAVRNVCRSIFLALILPKLSVAIHPSLYCVLAFGFSAALYFALPWPTNMWIYFGIHLLNSPHSGVWPTIRTLFTFCVEIKDIGKIYAAMEILYGMGPIISDPIYSQLYNAVRLFF